MAGVQQGASKLAVVVDLPVEDDHDRAILVEDRLIARLASIMSAESNSTCPVCKTAEVVCGKWTLLLIRDLAEGSARFCELERSLEGISPRTLSLRLRALEAEGLVERHPFPEVPPRVEYALTEKGEALVPLIEDMRRYGTRWLLEADPAAVPA